MLLKEDFHFEEIADVNYEKENIFHQESRCQLYWIRDEGNKQIILLLVYELARLYPRDTE